MLNSCDEFKLLNHRFPEVAELQNVWWLEIYGKIEARNLSPPTNYTVYFVFKLVEDRREFNERPVLLEVYFEWTDVNEGKMAILDPPQGTFMGSKERAYGWTEIEMGEIFNELGNDSIVFNLKEVDNLITKCGLIVEGIEIRPKNN